MSTAAPSRPATRRWIPRSVRARTALAAAAVAALVFGSGMVWMRQRLYDGQLDATFAAAQQQVDALLTATQANVRYGGDYGSLPYELVGGGGVLISSSAVLKPYETGGRPVMPDPGDGGSQPLFRQWTHRFEERSGGGALSGRTVTAVDGTISAGMVDIGVLGVRPGEVPAQARYRVYVFVTSTAADDAVARIDPFLLVGLPIAVLLVAATAGFAVRRSLRPVEAIRAETARVTARDPRERVAVPATGDELEALAHTINATLQRLDDASADQRRFVADAAHELRAPLTNLRTGLEVAQAYPAEADLPATVDHAVRSTRRLQGLVDDLLLLARLDATEPLHTAPVDLVALAVDVRADLPAGRVVVGVAHPGREALVDGDEGRLTRLLRNLVDNAVRHAATTVGIDVVAEADGSVRVDVHDDGAGIQPLHRESIFERFTRLDESRDRDAGGAGLGLAIAWEIAEAHGGRLFVVPTDPGTGATFRLSLPGISGGQVGSGLGQGPGPMLDGVGNEPGRRNQEPP